MVANPVIHCHSQYLAIHLYQAALNHFLVLTLNLSAGCFLDEFFSALVGFVPVSFGGVLALVTND